MKIRKGDSVVVTTGNDRGPTVRRVLEVRADGRKVKVEGVAEVFRHVKRGHPKSPQGGRLEIEMPIDASNVQYYCGSCEKPTRLGYRFTDAGAKERFCRRCDASAGVVSPPRARYAG